MEEAPSPRGVISGRLPPPIPTDTSWRATYDAQPDVTHLSWVSLHQDWGHLLTMGDATLAVAPEPGPLQLKEAREGIKDGAGEPALASQQSLLAIKNALNAVCVCVSVSVCVCVCVRASVCACVCVCDLIRMRPALLSWMLSPPSHLHVCVLTQGDSLRGASAVALSAAGYGSVPLFTSLSVATAGAHGPVALTPSPHGEGGAHTHTRGQAGKAHRHDTAE